MIRRRTTLAYLLLFLLAFSTLHALNSLWKTGMVHAASTYSDRGVGKRQFVKQNVRPGLGKERYGKYSFKKNKMPLLEKDKSPSFTETPPPAIHKSRPKPTILYANGNNDNNVHNYNRVLPDHDHRPAAQHPLRSPALPLFRHYAASGQDRSTLRERVASRRARHLAYLRTYAGLSDAAKLAENNALRDLYYMLEWNELDAFRTAVVWDPTDYGAAGVLEPAGAKVLVLTANDGRGNSEIGGVLAAALENRQEYCRYHGYTSYFVNLTKYARPGVHPVWSKVCALREAFEQNPAAEWVWWLDTDAIITNPQYAVAEHVLHAKAMEQRVTYGRPLRNRFGNWTNGIYMEPGEIDFSNIDMVISQDFYGLNAGSFFIRRSNFTDTLLDIWDDPLQIGHGWERLEQDALGHLFFAHERVQQHVALAPQRLFNSYTDSPEGVWTWQPGDFVIHLAGCNIQGRCETQFHHYWNKRIQVPVEYWSKNRIDLSRYRRNLEE